MCTCAPRGDEPPPDREADGSEVSPKAADLRLRAADLAERIDAHLRVLEAR